MAGRLVSVRTDTRNEINAERLSNIYIYIYQESLLLKSLIIGILYQEAASTSFTLMSLDGPSDSLLRWDCLRGEHFRPQCWQPQRTRCDPTSRHLTNSTPAKRWVATAMGSRWGGIFRPNVKNKSNNIGTCSVLADPNICSQQGHQKFGAQPALKPMIHRVRCERFQLPAAPFPSLSLSERGQPPIFLPCMRSPELSNAET